MLLDKSLHSDLAVCYLLASTSLVYSGAHFVPPTQILTETHSSPRSPVSSSTYLLPLPSAVNTLFPVAPRLRGPTPSPLCALAVVTRSSLLVLCGPTVTLCLTLGTCLCGWCCHSWSVLCFTSISRLKASWGQRLSCIHWIFQAPSTVPYTSQALNKYMRE